MGDPLAALMARVPELPARERPRSPRRWYVFNTLKMLPIVAGPLIVAQWFAGGALPGLLVGVGTLVFLIRRRQRRSNALLAENERGTELLEQGRLEDAAALFDRLVVQSRPLPWIQALLVYNRGCVDLRRGDFDGARARFTAALRSGWIRPRGLLATIAPKVYARLSANAALAGELDEARAWRERGEDLQGSVRRDWLLPDALIAARAGEWERLLTMLEDERQRAEASLTVSRMRQLLLLKGFAIERAAGAQYRATHGESDIEAALAGIRSGEFDSMATRWPELGDFMARRGLLDLR